MALFWVVPDNDSSDEEDMGDSAMNREHIGGSDTRSLYQRSATSSLRCEFLRPRCRARVHRCGEQEGSRDPSDRRGGTHPSHWSSVTTSSTHAEALTSRQPTHSEFGEGKWYYKEFMAQIR